MDLKTWLEVNKGSSIRLANYLGVSKAQVSQWKTGPIPLKYMKGIRDFTRGMVSLDDLVPDWTPGPKAKKD